MNPIQTTDSSSSAPPSGSNSTANDPFVKWWTNFIKVASIPLALFFFTLVCLGVVLLCTICICILRSYCRYSRGQKRPKRPIKGLYLDEVPGLVDGVEIGSYGCLEYSLEYHMNKQELKVGLTQAMDLASRPGAGLLDPYVKVFLEMTPNEDASEELLLGKTTVTKKFKTSVQKQTNNPCWNEAFIFKLPYNTLKCTSVIMNIYDYDSIGLDNAIGRLRVDLKNVDMNHFIGKTMELTGWLEKGEDMDLGTGDLCVVLKQNSADQSLHVTVLEAKRLKLDESRLGGVPDTFVSVKLQYGRRTLNVKHTVVRHSTKTPYFGDVLVFPIKSSKLPLAKVVCKLKYKSKLGIKHVLGRVVIGPEADVAGKKQWQEMLNDPRRAVAMWHTLYPSKYDATDE